MPWRGSHAASISYNKNQDPDNYQLGQTASHQINNYDDVQRYLEDKIGYPSITISNGYSFATPEDLQRLNVFLRSDRFDVDEIRQRMKVGIHESVGVTHISRDDIHPSILSSEVTSPMLVTQVYCSAFSCGYSGVSNELWQPMASLVLDAIYEATLLAAITRRPRTVGGIPVVYLTFVGGGVFQNDMEWIVGSIVRAVKKLRDMNTDLIDSGKMIELDVVICHFRSINASVKDAINAQLLLKY